MTVLGLCGQSGSGKSTVSSYFREKGAEVLCADTIYHSLISNKTPCLEKIEETFGKEVIKDGSLDRKKMAAIVFADKNKLELLNRITHPFVCKVIRDSVEKMKSTECDICLIDAPLLFEAGLDKDCDIIIGVIAPFDERIKRLIKRDGLSAPEAEKRLSNQLSDKIIEDKSDLIINNNKGIEYLFAACDDIINKIRSTE